MDQISSSINALINSFFTLILFLSVQLQTAAIEAKYLINPPCSRPITYNIGQIDPRFNLKEDDFARNIVAATEVWEGPIGRDLFTFDPNGSLTISMVFDERQSFSNQINQLQGELKTQKESLNPQVADLKARSQVFNQQVTNLNNEIEYWNSRGGAPQEEYEKIKKREEELRTEAQKLNQLAASLNQLTTKYNVNVNNLNQTIGSFNAELEERPEEGIYKSENNSIEIYFNNSQNELIHTLAHELGHSLKLDHLGNPKAIMYSKSTQTLTATEGDIDSLKTVCRIKNE